MTKTSGSLGPRSEEEGTVPGGDGAFLAAVVVARVGADLREDGVDQQQNGVHFEERPVYVHPVKNRRQYPYPYKRVHAILFIS